jgi:hypothetical protein
MHRATNSVTPAQYDAAMALYAPSGDDLKSDLPWAEDAAKAAAVVDGKALVAEPARFVFAGHACFTLVSKASGQRYTFKLAEPKESDRDPPPLFVSLLNGPDNTVDYAYVGAIFDRDTPWDIRHTRASRVGPEAPSVKALRWWLHKVATGDPRAEQVECWHEGCCGRCGRKLTVPESIASGFGPECIGKL